MMKQYGEPVFGLVKENEPEVVTKAGLVRGESRDGVAIFRGIPYGNRCDGAHRFLPPRPAEPWQGVRDCTHNGPIAVQQGGSISGDSRLGPYFSGGHPERFGVADERQSENCLVLNVLTPCPDAGKRPVLVYLHGGGFSGGTGTLVLGGDTFVREQDIVLVGVNHRLNVLGYLYLGELDKKYAASGMAGMLDLVLALQWVRDNIAAFGGDAQRVTIMGESGGGVKVNALLAMPQAAGLFQQAIVESGSGNMCVFTPEQAAQTTRRLLKRLNLAEKSALPALLQLPAEVLLEKAAEAGVVDAIGPVFEDTARFGLEVTPYGKNIPLLVGSSQEEMAVFSPPQVFSVTQSTLCEALLHPPCEGDFLMGRRFTQKSADKVACVFATHNTKQDTPEHLYLQILSLGNPLGGAAFYQAMEKARAGGAPVYHYAVNYDAPLPGMPGKRYAWHTADLPLQLRIVLHRESEALSRTMAQAWGAFVRTGSPATQLRPWPVFTHTQKQVMLFDEVCGVQKDPWKPLREVLEQTESDR